MPRPAVTSAEAEYATLQDALQFYTPPCAGDDRYTADELDEAARAELSAGCDLCNIRPLCRAYAQSARPKGGFWAGKRYSNNPPARTGTKEKE